ncbi:DUF975 family protein [Clostridium sp. E02]|uniref:DUF975 family protein n=1 Tax=Clostridium sp. E02 TaxID=2487134 RepID=UPI000F51D4EB|nr:DUF975 family protein [Clostridium sp. E02]
MSREVLKMDAKVAMSAAPVSPYMVAIILGVINLVFSSIQFFLDTWERILTNSNADLAEYNQYFISFLVYILIYFIVESILQYGFHVFCLKVANRDASMSYGDIFSGVKYFFKVIGLAFMSGLFIALWTLLLIVPGIIATYRYSQIFFILAENPEKGILQCIRESKEMMVGHKWEYFVLEMSFILWHLLALVTCFLSYIYVYPYTMVTFANYYNRIKPQNNRKEESVIFES